ncbi:MAG: hypothetical protein AABN95_16675 [Acidobacteriota bacterium]
MNPHDLMVEILAVYQKHGWQVRRLLLKPETRAQLDLTNFPDGLRLDEASVDAMWVSRASHGGREAWELRLLAEQPYALFETFETDETEEQREELRGEMEARMREYAER